jgi:hypothetical protein
MGHSLTVSRTGHAGRVMFYPITSRAGRQRKGELDPFGRIGVSRPNPGDFGAFRRVTSVSSQTKAVRNIVLRPGR